MDAAVAPALVPACDFIFTFRVKKERNGCSGGAMETIRRQKQWTTFKANLFKIFRWFLNLAINFIDYFEPRTSSERKHLIWDTLTSFQRIHLSKFCSNFAENHSKFFKTFDSHIYKFIMDCNCNNWYSKERNRRN